MFYFKNFPKVNYSVSGNSTTVVATDITKRFRFIDAFVKNKYIFYSYSVKEGERADIIADKYYGDSSYDWLIFMLNQIFDPFFDWPMTSDELENYIIDKYGSLETAKQTVYEYYQVLQDHEILYDGTNLQLMQVVIDQAAYNLLDDPSRSLITQYDWEKQQNEVRRIIKLVDKAYLSFIVQEINTIFG